MEIIILVLVIFAVSSFIKGVSGQSSTNSNRPTRDSSGGNYTRTGNRSDSNSSRPASGNYDRNAMARTQEQVDYNKVTTRNDNLREMEERLSKSLRNLKGEIVRPAQRNYAKTASTGSNVRKSNNYPTGINSYNNHTESSAALRDEVHESIVLWHENLGRMHVINMEFERHIAQQHADQQRWVRDAQSMDR